MSPNETTPAPQEDYHTLLTKELQANKDQIDNASAKKLDAALPNPGLVNAIEKKLEPNDIEGTLKGVQKYLNGLDLNGCSGKEGKALQDLVKGLQLRDSAHPELYAKILKEIDDKTLTTAPEKKEVSEGENVLFDLLSVPTNINSAKNLFGDNGVGENGKREKAWTAIQGHIVDGQFKVGDTTKLDSKKLADATTLEANFTNLVKLYAKKETVEKDNKKIPLESTLQILSNTNGKIYIKVTYADKTYKDIMFGKDPNVIHEARSNEVSESKLEEFAQKIKTRKLKETLKDMENSGAHRTLLKLLNKGLITFNDVYKKDTTDNNIFQEINNTYKGNGDERENGYYSVINTYVCEKANAGDLITVSSYLEAVNANTVYYLGIDPKTQKENYNRLSDIVVDPITKKRKPGWEENTRTTVKSDIITKIGNIRGQLYENIKMKERITDDVKKIFDTYGEQIIAILERFGGKGCVKKFFHSLGMDKFYAEHLDAIQQNIDKIYKKKFSLTQEQKDAIDNNILTTKVNNSPVKNFDDTKFPKNTDIDKAIDEFRTKKKDPQGATNEATFTERLKAQDTSLRDPNLVINLVQKDFSGTSLKENEKPLNKNDFVIKVGDKREMKKGLGEKEKKELTDRLLADKTTWDKIKTANKEIDGYKINEESTKEEISRSDLGKKDDPGRRKFLIQSDEDIAKWLASYAFAGGKNLSYVITENQFKNNGSKDNSGETTTQKITLKDEKLMKDGKVTTEGKGKFVEDIVDAQNSPDKLRITDPSNGRHIDLAKEGDEYLLGGKRRYSVLPGRTIEPITETKTPTKPGDKKDEVAQNKNEKEVNKVVNKPIAKKKETKSKPIAKTENKPVAYTPPPSNNGNYA